MKLALMLSGLISLGLVACTIESNDGGSSAKTGPVSSAPLTGTIEGKSFAGKFAIAEKGVSDEGERMISIYDTEVPCHSMSMETPEAYLLLTVPWEAGTKRDFSFGSRDSQTATFVVKKGEETSNIISTQGRVEILEAPTEVGATGTMRLRAEAKGNRVEGEVSVQVCD